MSLLSPDYEGGWSLADHARYILEDEARLRRKAEDCARKQEQIKRGFAVDSTTQYERRKLARKVAQRR